MASVIVDRVSIDLGAGHNLISVDKWLLLPLSRRTRLLMENKVRFLSGAAIVPVREALVALKKSSGANGG